ILDLDATLGLDPNEMAKEGEAPAEKPAAPAKAEAAPKEKEKEKEKSKSKKSKASDEDEEELSDEENEEEIAEEEEEEDDFEEGGVSLATLEANLMPSVMEQLDHFAKLSKEVLKLQERHLAHAFGKGKFS